MIENDINDQGNDITSSDIRFVEELKAQWMATVDALIDPLIVVDKDLSVIKANKTFAKHVGKDIKELIGKKCYILSGLEKECEGCLVRECFSDCNEKSFSLNRIIHDRFYEISCQPFIRSRKNKEEKEEQVTVEGVVVLYKDKTREKEIESRLRRSDKLSSIGMLSGGVAHEINNPLCGIIAFSQVLEKELREEISSYNEKNSYKKNLEDHLKDVTEIIEAARRCKGIVEDLLLFARQGNDSIKKVQIQSVDIIEVIDTAIKLAKLTVSKMDLKIEKDYYSSSVKINSDFQKLLQVFVNIIQNAIQAMYPSSGTLSIKVEKIKEEVCIHIKDTGSGIKKEILDKIFDPFFTTKDVGVGTGLGLSICHGIITEMDGRIEVESKENEGSCFSIYLKDHKILNN